MKDALRRAVRNSRAYDTVRAGRLEARTLFASERRLPDFMVIGTHKGGTSSFYRNMCSHPQVFEAMVKEVQHFDRVPMRSDRWYRGHFPTQAEVTAVGGITGEASPSYCVLPHVPARVRATVPDTKIIMLLRDPVKRAYSNFQFDQRRGGKPMSFEDWVDHNLNGIGDRKLDVAAFDDLLMNKDMRELRISLGLIRGVYVSQIRKWHESFPKEQVTILDSTDYFSDPSGCLNTVLKETFNLPPHEFTYQKTRHEGRGYGSMKPETAERLQAFFKPYNEELYGYLDRDFGW